MKKKSYLILFLTCVTVVACFVWYMLQSSKPEIYSRTSDRAREFIESQQRSGNQEWVGKNIDATGTPSQSLLDVPGCFSIQLQYTLQFSRQDKDKDCSVFLKLKDGLEMTVYITPISYDSINADSGVILRRKDTQLYLEEHETIHGLNYLIFTKRDESPEITALTQKDKTLFVLNLMGSSSKTDRKKIDQMLQSVVFYNE